jgi:hypothetical protein
MNFQSSSKTSVIFILILLLAAVSVSGITISTDVKQVPFKLERNRVIIPTSVNGSPPYDLILDTGMGFDGVYLFHKEFANEIDTTGSIEVRVPGAGSGEASTAVMIESGRLEFGDVTVDSQRVIISNSPHTQGFPTDGVIGWNLFGHYTVEINYDTELITLHDTAAFKADSSWFSLPITLKNGLPFFESKVEVIDGEILDMTMYIDLASGDAIELLTGPNQKYTLPEALDSGYLATGLSGDIHGYRGWSRHLWLGDFMLSDIATLFAPEKVRSKQEGADGILGNDCIRRFNVVFDYTNRQLHLKPSKYFNVAFEQND